MKNKRFNFLMKTFFLFAIFSMVIVSCKKDPVAEDPIASFQYEASTDNYLEVTFTNYSQNATTYSWDFGDGESSTEKNPVHTYAGDGTYTVVLTASNADGVSATFSENFTLTDPIGELRILTGDDSKEWRLLREGVSVGVSPDAGSFGSWWGLSNDGTRPCKYFHTWTFHTDGTFDFDDAGYMFGDDFVFNDTQAQYGTCFEATAANMVNKDGTDISSWLSGTHNFDFDPLAGKLTVSGDGAWIGMIKVTPGGDVAVPQSSIVYDISISEGIACDTMLVSVTGDGFYWGFKLVSYDNPVDEPDVVTDAAPWGEDLPDVTPTSLGHTFASDAGGTGGLDTVASVSTVVFGVDAAGTTSIGEFTRTSDQYQELKMMIQPDPQDIQFDNFTQVSVDVYFPSSNTYTGTAANAGADGLTQFFEIGFADASQTQEWWNGLTYYNSQADGELAEDTWITLTYDIADVKARTDIDMIIIRMGGNGHTEGGTFYIRNLIFQ